MLINLRNALMAGKRLPYDAEVECLQSTGTQYINTGYMLSGPTTFKLSASFTPTRDERDFFGAHAANTQGSTVCGCYHNFVFGYNYPHARIDGASLGSSEITTDIEYALSQSSRTLKVNGTTYSGNGATFPNLAVTLFRGNENTAYYGQFKCYAFQIYDANNTLVRDYIPVRKGTTGELYDRVSGKFAERHGEFVLGPDVVPVEYIESHGTEYIDTGVVPTSLTKWDIDAQFTSSDYGQIMGRGGTPSLNPRFAFGLDIQSSGHGLTWYCGMGNVNTWNGTFNTFRHTFSLDAPYKTFTIDTTSYSVPFSSIGDTTIMQLFARFVNGSVQNFCKAKIFKSSIIDNGLPVRSFRPVRVGSGSTWEGAMMDVLTRRIYRNAGTGTFGYGNDLKYPIPAE